MLLGYTEMTLSPMNDIRNPFSCVMRSKIRHSERWIENCICIFCRSDFPQLGGQSGRGSKNNTPVKATPGASLSRQKSTGARTAENPPSFSMYSHSSLKGKNNSSSKYSGIDRTFIVHLQLGGEIKLNYNFLF